jgi:hypothetical protein
MEIRDDAVERAKAINEAVARFTRRKLEVPAYLAGLAARLKPVPAADSPPEPAPEPEPAVEKAEAVAPEPVAPTPEATLNEAVPAEKEADPDTAQATEEVDQPVVRRGRPPRR